MPILYLEPANWETSTDPVVVALRDSQFVDWGELRYLERTDGAYRRAIDELVTRLRDARDAAPGTPDDDRPSHPGLAAEDDHDDDLLESVEVITDLVGELESHRVPDLLAALEGLAETFEAIAPALEQAGTSPSPRHIRAALREAVEPMLGPAAALEAECESTNALTTRLDETIAKLLKAAAEAETLDAFGMDDLLESLAEMSGGLDLDMGSAKEAQALIRQLAVFSREMKPVARAIDATVRVFTDIDKMTRRWGNDAERILGRA